MGQAKSRGSFEQRQVEGVARRAAEAQAQEIERARLKREAAEQQAERMRVKREADQRRAASPPQVREHRRQSLRSHTMLMAVAMATMGTASRG